MNFPKPQTRSLRSMRRFDALELHACVELVDDHGEKFIEQADEELTPTMFSVYRRHLLPRRLRHAPSRARVDEGRGGAVQVRARLRRFLGARRQGTVANRC